MGRRLSLAFSHVVIIASLRMAIGTLWRCVPSPIVFQQFGFRGPATGKSDSPWVVQICYTKDEVFLLFGAVSQGRFDFRQAGCAGLLSKDPVRPHGF
jgi:hypothetical protein